MGRDTSNRIYDGGAYRSAVQRLRDVRARVDQLPEQDRNLALDMLDMAVKNTYAAVLTYRDEQYGKANFSDDAKVLPHVRDALAAMVDACATMLEPEKDPSKMDAPGTSSDFATDRRGLQELQFMFRR